MPNVVYNGVKAGLMHAELNFAVDTLYIALVTDMYIPDVDTHVFMSDITGEVVGVGYTQGGLQLQNVNLQLDLVNNRESLFADDPLWSNSTIVAKGAIIYKNTGVPTTSKLITYLDFGENKSSNASPFLIAFDSTGILRLV